MNNLHINLNELTNPSRVLKQTKSLTDSGIVKKLYISGLYKDGLDENYIYDDGRELKRFPLRSRKLSKNFFVQIFKYLEYCFKVYQFYKDKNIGMVNIHTLGLLPLGLFLKYMYKAILVYDTHELESETNGKKGFRKKLGKWMEKSLIKHVDMTLVVSESIADWYAKEYNIRRPSVIMNAPNKRELKVNNHFRENLGIRDNQIILLYQGGLMSGRGINLILDAFKARIDDKVVVVFMGYGGLEQDIKSAANTYHNIFFFPAVPPHIVLEYTSSADLGISLIEKTCLSYYFCMPNKLFEYAMAGLPVLVSNMKDMSELVVRNNMGAVVSDFSASGISQAVDNFLDQDLTNMKKNAYQVACDNAWEVQEQKMLAAYKNMFEQKGIN
ncbi:glycosyltransferase [Acinetobacter sp. YH12116]|uniref:glycosyltransferase n=1 Tax=Acinetobacter sp. YH12116 TaxID=2601103 RepID=UPI0015D2BB81|nr:glycosyltransferase [Acinetobacter sp. YH12116]